MQEQPEICESARVSDCSQYRGGGIGFISEQYSLASVISANLVSMLAFNARVPGSNPTIDGYFSTSLKAL